MTELTLRECQQTVDEWINSVGITYFPELTNLGILMEEVGELSRLMVRMYGEQSFKRPEDTDQAPQNLSDEMADVLFVLMALANQTGVDLSAAFQRTMQKKTQRDAERHQNNAKLQNLKKSER